MSVSIRVVLIGSICFAALLPSTVSAAICSGDIWGGRSSAIVQINAEQARIIAQTNVVHLASHPICQGNFTARATMLGIGASCSTSTVTKTHFPSGLDTLAYVERVCLIPTCGFTYWTGGIHSGFDEAEHYTESPESAYTPCPCQPPSGGCTIEGCVWSEIECACVDCCPLIVDTSGRGYKLTSPDDGVMFDINADGRQDAISWTDPRRDVGLLAFDRNGNGTIDNGEELFGNVTPLQGGASRRARHGFEALADLESEGYGPSVEDGTIDARDAAYHRLLLWVDRNHDGISQASEVMRASAAGLVAIETKYRESRRRDQFGNEFRLRGVSWWMRGRLEARLFYDVWFVPKR